MDNMKAYAAMLSIFITLSGCAHRGKEYAPVVDLRPDEIDAYPSALRDCQWYASSAPSTGEGAIGGAVAGGVVMALLAPKGYRNNWAATGAAIGATGGAVGATVNQQEVIKTCLRGRGYSVLY